MVEYISTPAALRALLRGDIDHHSARFMRESIDYELSRLSPPALILDFSGVGFIDSSGIGLVLGRYKAMSALGGAVYIENASPSVARMLRLGGIETLLKIA